MLIRLVAVVITIGLASCTPKPVTIETWSAVGLRLDHPSTWTIHADKPLADNPDTRALQLQGPNHALLILTVLPAANRTSPAEFAKQVADSRAQAMGDHLKVAGIPLGGEAGALPASRIRMRVAGHDVDGVEERFSIEVLTASVPHIARTLAADVGGHHVIVTLQAPEKDWAGAQNDVQGMLDSLTADR